VNIGEQVAFLLILAIPVAAIAWTVTHEDIFREARDWCKQNSQTCNRLYRRKFFYLFTCEYCFSHYVVIAFLILTRYKLLFSDWRGYLISGFSLVWVANVYMNLFSQVRLDIKRDRVEIAEKENVPSVVLTPETATSQRNADHAHR
jgi:hypothetical protein